MNITENESLFCQAIGTLKFLLKLNEISFLESEDYKALTSSEDLRIIKGMMGPSGIGNPATLQMTLYALLVMPKELLQNVESSVTSAWEIEFNALAATLVGNVATTYNGEDSNNKSTIKYYYHLRNAVAHSKCNYTTVDNISYVTFKDEKPNNPNINCEMTFLTGDAGLLCTTLQNQLLKYLEEKFTGRY